MPERLDEEELADWRDELDEQFYQDEDPSDDFRGGSWNSSALDNGERGYVSDDDIQQMFGTLRDGN